MAGAGQSLRHRRPEIHGGRGRKIPEFHQAHPSQAVKKAGASIRGTCFFESQFGLFSVFPVVPDVLDVVRLWALPPAVETAKTIGKPSIFSFYAIPIVRDFNMWCVTVIMTYFTISELYEKSRENYSPLSSSIMPTSL